MTKMIDANWCAVLAATVLITAGGCQSAGTTDQTISDTNSSPVNVASAVTTERPAPAELGLKTVFFDYDRWQLREEAQGALRSNARQINERSETGVVTVMGHCDERGSEEYNLALGERRAEAVKRYLVDLGVDASRIRTVSFGEARPAVSGEGEPVWSRNRRAELRLDTPQAAR